MSNALVAERTPTIIAAEINTIKHNTRMLFLQSAVEIGKRLTEAKSMVQHGEWGAWLEANVDYSQSTANNLMRVYEEYGNNQLSLFDQANSQALEKLSYTQAVALLGIPAYEREQFIEEHKVEDLSTRELQKLIQERDEARAQLEAASQTATKAEEERAKLAKEKAQLQEQIQHERQRSRDAVEKIARELEQARGSGTDENRVKQLEAALKDAEAKVETLERDAKRPVTLEPAVVERVPAEVERELQELRDRARRMGTSELVLKCRVQFDGVVSGFKALLQVLEELRTADEDSYQRYRKAVEELLQRMQGALI